MANDWTLDPAIQSELSDKWYDQPDVVAGIKLNTITVKPKEYERLNEAKRQYPYLQDKDFDYVENLTDDKKAGYLEFWEPGDEGPPDGSVKRPEGIGIDRMGIEVRNPDTRPIDILGDYVSHEAIYSDPKIKDIYDRYTSTLTDKQLQTKYEYEKKNYGEDRPFEQWAERSGKPGMFRGYTFDQFSEDEIKEAYTDEQLKILDEAKKYLGVKKLNYEGKDVTIPQNKEVLNVRNVKNNNLGNIKLTSDKWQGMVDNPDEKTFVTFKSPEYGIRALAKVVQANLNATNSYETYVNRYASEPNEQEYFEKNGKLMPHLENYAKLLAESQGIDTSKSDWIKQKPSNIDMKTWIKATARAEGGEDTLSYFTDDVIQKGLDLLK